MKFPLRGCIQNHTKVYDLQGNVCSWTREETHRLGTGNPNLEVREMRMLQKMKLKMWPERDCPGNTVKKAL